MCPIRRDDIANAHKVNLMRCPKITGVGVQWLTDGCPGLSSLNVKGTKATLTALNILRERYPYSEIKVQPHHGIQQSKMYSTTSRDSQVAVQPSAAIVVLMHRQVKIQ